MRTPTIHWNGTGASELRRQNHEALKAVMNAVEALQKAAPHGRDYYVQNSATGPDASSEAHNEHLSRISRLVHVGNELQSILDSITAQKGHRS